MTDFTGLPTWHDTITGPSNGDQVNGPSVCDMGVLLADRTTFLAQDLVTVLAGVSIAGSLRSITGEDPFDLESDGVTVTIDRDSVVMPTLRGPLATADAGAKLSVRLRATDGVTTVDTYATEIPVGAKGLINLGGRFALTAGDWTFYVRAENLGSPTAYGTIATGIYSLTALVIASIEVTP